MAGNTGLAPPLHTSTSSSYTPHLYTVCFVIHVETKTGIIATRTTQGLLRTARVAVKKMRFADIAVNLTDPMYRGEYHGKSRHQSDLDAVVKRASHAGVDRILITGTSLSESKEALSMADRFNLHCTAGCHPTSTSEMEAYERGPEQYIKDLNRLIEEDRGEGGSRRIISIGEIGLDYDRLHYAPKEVQLRHFPTLLGLSKSWRLPLFLHSRTSEAHVDFVRVLREAGWDESWPGGVVHSFTGTAEEVKELVSMGLYIGINGCSLKTEGNLEVVKTIPLDKLLLETDGPWCSVTTSHASSPYLPDKDSPLYIPKVSKAQQWKEGSGVKGRMEPAEIRVIAHIVAKVKGVELEDLAQAVWANTTRLFYPDETKSQHK